MTPLTAQLSAELRGAVKDAYERLKAVRDWEVGDLEASEEWPRLPAAERQRLVAAHGLQPVPAPSLSTDEALLALAASLCDKPHPK